MGRKKKRYNVKEIFLTAQELNLTCRQIQPWHYRISDGMMTPVDYYPSSRKLGRMGSYEYKVVNNLHDALNNYFNPPNDGLIETDHPHLFKICQWAKNNGAKFRRKSKIVALLFRNENMIEIDVICRKFHHVTKDVRGYFRGDKNLETFLSSLEA